MESITEKLDKSRYQLIKWLTIGWALWYGTFIIKDFNNNKIVFGIVLLTGIIGWTMFIINLIRFLKLGKLINSDINLRTALNNEFIQFNSYKSALAGFIAMTICICIFLVVSNFYMVSALLVCRITLYFGILAALIASLLYNRD
jgi:hypothetical protein